MAPSTARMEVMAWPAVYRRQMRWAKAQALKPATYRWVSKKTPGGELYRLLGLACRRMRDSSANLETNTF